MLMLSGCSFLFTEQEPALVDASGMGSLDASGTGSLDASGTGSLDAGADAADAGNAATDCMSTLLINGDFDTDLDSWSIAAGTSATREASSFGSVMRLCPIQEAQAPFMLDVRSTLAQWPVTVDVIVTGRGRTNAPAGLPVGIFVLEEADGQEVWGDGATVVMTNAWQDFSATFVAELEVQESLTLTFFVETGAQTTCIELDKLCVTPVP